jgi:hypothetical protein
MAWQPQQESLQQLAYSLRDSLSGYDRARQKHAEEVCPTYSFVVIRCPRHALEEKKIG